MLMALVELPEIRGVVKVRLCVNGRNSVEIDVLVVDNELSEFDLLLGMDVIKKNSVAFIFLNLTVCETINISQPDFSVNFDQRAKKWILLWK